MSVTVAITMVRDEADILPWTLAHMLTQADHVIVADNGSTDDTSDILYDTLSSEGAERITVIEDPEPGYWQSRKMTRLARWAHDIGATWVVPFDADEAWTLPDADTLDRYDVIALQPYVFVPQPHDDHDQADPLRRTRWRQPHPEPHPKVMFRSRPDVVIDMGNHGVTYPGPHRWTTGPPVHLGGGRVRHYQYRSLEQVARKVRQGVAAYQAAPGLERYGAHWRELASLSDADLRAWWGRYIHQPLVEDPWPT